MSFVRALRQASRYSLSLPRCKLPNAMTRNFSAIAKGRRVLVCLDEKDHNETFDWIESNVLNPEDQIHILHVYEPIDAETLTAFNVAPSENVQKEIEEVLERNAIERASGLASKFTSKGNNTKVVALSGKPAGTICKYAKENGADIVLVGKRGESIGPVTEEVVKRCSRPVFLYPETDPMEDSVIRKRKKCKVRFHF